MFPFSAYLNLASAWPRSADTSSRKLLLHALILSSRLGVLALILCASLNLDLLAALVHLIPSTLL